MNADHNSIMNIQFRLILTIAGLVFALASGLNEVSADELKEAKVTQVIQDVAIPYVDGVLGSDDMHRIGAVLDCAEPAVYYAPRGPRSDTSSKLAAMLQSNGFTQIPMRLTSNHQLEVACCIDGVPSTIIVDTGSAATCVEKSIGIKRES